MSNVTGLSVGSGFGAGLELSSGLGGLGLGRSGLGGIGVGEGSVGLDDPNPKSSFIFAPNDFFGAGVGSAPGRGLILRASGGSGIRSGSRPPRSAVVRSLPSDGL